MSIVTDVEQQRAFLENIVSDALKLAHTKSESSEVQITKTTGINVVTRYGKVDSVEFNMDGMFSITVYNKYRKGKSSSNDFSIQAIINTVSNALDIANYTSLDIHSGIADKELLAYDVLDLDLFHPIELNTEFCVSLAAKAEMIAFEHDERIIYSEGGFFSSHYNICVFGNSHGMIQSYSVSQHSLSCCVVAKSHGGMERNYAYTVNRVYDKLCSPAWVGKECARRTLEKLNSRKLCTMETPVLLCAEVAISLFDHFADSINGHNVYKKSTFLLNYLGKRVFPSWLNIEEFPHILQELASAPFDTEGVKTNNLTIVKNGILNTWLLDSYSSRKLGLISNGHANGIYNWLISHQEVTFEQLVRKMYKGFIVTELMGQGFNIVTGDYSRGATGFWVDNGYIQYPVSEVTIAGNLKHMLKNIELIGNDIEIRSNIKCGSILLSSMKIAGY